MITFVQTDQFNNYHVCKLLTCYPPLWFLITTIAVFNTVVLSIFLFFDTIEHKSLIKTLNWSRLFFSLMLRDFLLYKQFDQFSFNNKLCQSQCKLLWLTDCINDKMLVTLWNRRNVKGIRRECLCSFTGKLVCCFHYWNISSFTV